MLTKGRRPPSKRVERNPHEANFEKCLVSILFTESVLQGNLYFYLPIVMARSCELLCGLHILS